MPFLQSIADAAVKREEHKKIHAQKKSWIHKHVYNTSKWRKLRLQKLSDQPLCECCKGKDKIKLATQVHHKVEISTGKTEDEMMKLAFDFNNLQSICRDCHKEQHTNNIDYFLFE